MAKEICWHSLSAKEVVKKLSSNAKIGLSSGEIKSRHKKFGKNILPKEKPLSKIIIFLEQFKSPLIYILVVAGIIVLIFRAYTDAVVIFGAVFLNIIVGFLQENKASGALEKLKKIVKIKAELIRDGNEKMIDSSEIAPGDIVILYPGNKVPADGRIIESTNLKINEMALTGEWLAADKKPNLLSREIPLADRDNMVYMGTVVEDGRAKIIAVAVGLNTEIGKIAKMVKETKEEKTPFQKKISNLAKIIGGIVVFVSILIFIEGILKGKGFLEMFTTSVAVSVAAIPEGLPVALTVILAIGMQRILKKKGLVRRLASAETLGSTSVIATDKTGTLTEGNMRVAEIVASRTADRQMVLKIAALCNDAFVENPEEAMDKWIVRGRPTDKALLMAGMEAGINKKKLEEKMVLTAELPFNPINKYIAKSYALSRKKDILYICGAPEKILEMSQRIKKNNREILLAEKEKKKIKEEIDKLAGKGLRVVAFSYKKIDNLRDLFKNLVFVGMIALKDPVRKEVKKAIKTVQEAGMRPIIVTGDHKLTAKAVAEEIGLKISKNGTIEGKELDDLTDRQLEKIIENIQIYARVEPKHKMRIIQAWQNKGQVIAMTGDGINDAPALKRADIGVALGSGTEVAKDVSDLVLLSDNFNVIVAAVEEGRVIIDNIRKVITYLLTSSFTETILVGFSLFLGFPLPITAVQILWVNLIEDGLPDTALAFEPRENDIMKQKPQGREKSLLNKEMKIIILFIGIITDFFLLGLFFWLFKKTNYTLEHIRTVVFATLAATSLLYVFSCKSLRKNIWQIDILSNKFLIYAWLVGATALLASVYLPSLQSLLKTYPLNFIDWAIVLGLSLIELILIEITKWVFITRRIKN